MPNTHISRKANAHKVPVVSVQERSYHWYFVHSIFSWILRLVQYIPLVGSRQPVKTCIQIKKSKATLDIVGRDEAERRARKLLWILDLPLLDVGIFIEALNIDRAGTNKILALYGDAVQRILLIDTAREASSKFTADLIEKSILDLTATNTARTNAALCHGLCRTTTQQGCVQVAQLYRYMYHLSLGPDRGTYSAEWNRIGDTTEAVLGAVYLASGSDWRHNCLDVMTRLGLDAPTAWKKLWNDRKVSFREVYGQQAWSDIESVGRGAFFG